MHLLGGRRGEWSEKWNELRFAQQPQGLHGLGGLCQECTRAALSLPLPANTNMLAWLRLFMCRVTCRQLSWVRKKEIAS